MVDVVGHLGMALLWLSPAWVVLDRPKTAGTFVLSGVLFGMLPDVDLGISQVVSLVKHHGVFHTVVVVTALAAVIGPLLGSVLERVVGESEWFALRPDETAARFGFLAVWIAGLAHVFADVLSAPDVAEAIEPFWPLYRQSLGIDVVWYDNPWFNRGLFVTGVIVNVGLYVYRN